MSNPTVIIAGLLRRVTQYAERHGEPAESDVWGEIEKASECLQQNSDQRLPLRCLVVVSGGIADPVYDDGIDVVVFDWDNFGDDTSAGREELKVPMHFQDIADPLGIPTQAA